MDEVQKIADELAGYGILVSFVYGSHHGLEKFWSTDVLAPGGKFFEKPFAAKSLLHAAEIARHECEKRDWLKQ